MPFDFQPKQKSRKEYGGSVANALRDEVSQFGRAHRKHSLRKVLGMDSEEGEGEGEGMEMEGAEKPSVLDASECPDCAAGTCDDPEHMSDGEKDAMAGLVIAITPKK